MEILTERLIAVASRQRGQFTRAQAIASGTTPAGLDHLQAAGIVDRVTAEVLRLRSVEPHPFPGLYAHWLMLDPLRPAWTRHAPECGVVSHRSALVLFGVAGPAEAAVEFILPSRPAAATARPTVVRVAALSPEDWREEEGLPVTTPARTLTDLAVDVGLSLRELGRVAEAFLQRGLTDSEELSEALDAHVPGDGGHARGSDYLTVILAAAKADGRR
ncbi:hypothetical protein [Streptosporangium sp. OZ121]|uniref:hypothetical protein n=1 Tax=Streptosporangium sp. OZ121 TaxID=3444183 RepID=UPI003F7A7C82